MECWTKQSQYWCLLDKTVTVLVPAGIGLEIAAQLLSLGDIVVLCSRSIDKLSEENATIRDFVDRGQAFLVSADLSTTISMWRSHMLTRVDLMCPLANDEAGCEELMSAGLRALGDRLDVLVNDAGLFYTVSTEETTADIWRKTHALNLDAAFHLTKMAAQHLAKTKGNVVNISSVASYRPEAGALAYCVSKAGLDMLTRGSAQDLAPKGIRVNSVNPGEVETPIFKTLGGMSDEEVEKYVAKWSELNPLGRIGQPKDIAYLAIFLLDNEKAGWITGQCIVVDGGARSFACQS